MEKVKITQEQADAIEGVKDDILDSFQEFKHHPDRFVKRALPLRDLSVDEYQEALYVGYEVKKEFKTGDWVVRGSDGIISQITNIDYSVNRHGGIFTDRYAGWFTYSCFRHATDEEITTEKKRRFWKGNDREVDDFRSGDLFSPRNGNVYEVTQFVSGSTHPVKFVNNYGNKDSYRLDAGLKIVCFKEDRKDIN